MTPAILGTKIGMTRVYDDKGAVVPVTVVSAEPNVVTQVKAADGKDQYNAVQLGYKEIAPRRSTMPQIGHVAKHAGATPRKHFREIRLKDATDRKAGDAVSVEVFDGVQFVDVTGTSKGKGFAGVMKRWNFGGQPASHGTERKHRSRGSIASMATNRGHSGKPKKGLGMAGQLGVERVTTRNHPLVRVDKENNLLLIKGALPGPNGGLLFIKKAITAKEKPAE